MGSGREEPPPTTSAANAGDAAKDAAGDAAGDAADSRSAASPTFLRAAVSEFPPYAERTPDDGWTGTAVELFRATARDAGCEVEFIAMSPPEILRAIARDELDAIAIPLAVTPLTSTLVSLTPSFMTSSLHIAVFRDDLGGDLALLVRSLTTPRQLQVYALMLVLVVTFAVLVWLMERSRNTHFRGRRHEGIGSGLWWSITTLSTVGYGDKVPVSPVGRLLAGTWMMLSLVLVAIFTATVTSSITAHDNSVEVDGAHDLPRARVGIVEDGLASGYVNNHFLPHVSYPQLQGAIDDLQAGNLDAVVADIRGIERTVDPARDEHILVLDTPVDRVPLSFGFRRSISRDFALRFDAALVARMRAEAAARSEAPNTPAASDVPAGTSAAEALRTPRTP